MPRSSQDAEARSGYVAARTAGWIDPRPVMGQDTRLRDRHHPEVPLSIAMRRLLLVANGEGPEVSIADPFD